MTGGPPLVLPGAAHVEDVPEPERQHLVWSAAVRLTAIEVKERSEEEELWSGTKASQRQR